MLIFPSSPLTNVWIPNLNTIIFNEPRTVIALYSCQHSAQGLAHLSSDWLRATHPAFSLVHPSSTQISEAPGLLWAVIIIAQIVHLDHRITLNRNVLTYSHNIACNLLLRYEIFSEKRWVVSGIPLSDISIVCQIFLLFDEKTFHNNNFNIYDVSQQQNILYISEPENM